MFSELMCEKRAAPTNGRVVNSVIEDGVRVTEIRYQCYSGYRMSGSPTVRCSDNGYWTNDVPQCQRRYSYFTYQRNWFDCILYHCLLN